MRPTLRSQSNHKGQLRRRLCQLQCSVKTEGRERNPCFMHLGGSGTGSVASAQAARIVHSSTGRTSSVEPQTAQDAQEYLKNLSGFGPGVLQRKDGTGLAPGSRLQPGQEYVFMPSAAPAGKMLKIQQILQM